MEWFRQRRTEDAEPVQLSRAAIELTDQLCDHHHDGDWPTSIGWYLPDEEPPWDALKELRRHGYCEVERDGDEISIAFTELGRRLFT
jgi:hypothetical protein